MIKGDPTLAKKMVTPEALKETGIEVVTLVWSLENTDMERERGWNN